MSICKLKVKDKVYNDNNRIGVNLGGWINMETWIFDTTYFMPSVGSDNRSINTNVSNGNNYQRAELGTIREINRIYMDPGNQGNDSLEWSSFNDNIPPTNRYEPSLGGAKDLMSLHWATFLSKLVDDKNSISFTDIFNDNYTLKKKKKSYLVYY